MLSLQASSRQHFSYNAFGCGGLRAFGPVAMGCHVGIARAELSVPICPRGNTLAPTTTCSTGSQTPVIQRCCFTSICTSSLAICKQKNTNPQTTINRWKQSWRRTTLWLRNDQLLQMCRWTLFTDRLLYVKILEHKCPFGSHFGHIPMVWRSLRCASEFAARATSIYLCGKQIRL